MSPNRRDDAPVTWGELRKAVELVVEFCGELSVYTAISTANVSQVKEQQDKILALGKQLNGFVGSHVVAGIPDE